MDKGEGGEGIQRAWPRDQVKILHAEIIKSLARGEGGRGEAPSVQGEDLRLVQEADLLLVQEADLLLVQEEDLLLVQEADLLLAQEEDLLLVQEEVLLLCRSYMIYVDHI